MRIYPRYNENSERYALLNSQQQHARSKRFSLLSSRWLFWLSCTPLLLEILLGNLALLVLASKLLKNDENL
jgi:hypothetical protein